MTRPDWHQHYENQTAWISAHAQSHNIRYALHLGDVVDDNGDEQWTRARSAMDALTVPYAITVGNHDYGPNGNAANRDTLFNADQYFGSNSPYAQQASVGGFFEDGRTDNSYHAFSAAGQQWLVLSLEWGPRHSVVDWANGVVAAHADHHAILLTHAYTFHDDTRYDWAQYGNGQRWSPHISGYGTSQSPEGTNDGQELWDKLVSQHDNFRLVFSGHVLGDGAGYVETDGVHQMLSNYQRGVSVDGVSSAIQGWMRLLEFKTDGTVAVKTYSPSLAAHNRAADQEFSFVLPETAALPGDFNLDRQIDAADLTAWQDGFGSFYDGADFLLWQRSLSSPMQPVPEPGLIPFVAAILCSWHRVRPRSHGSPRRYILPKAIP